MSERVLIIDDKETVREVFRAHLAEAGFAVDVACSLPEAAMRLPPPPPPPGASVRLPASRAAGDGACSLPEAAMRLAATPYSAVISDVSLSEEEAGKEGLAIAAYIRALWDDVPVVILSRAPQRAAAAAPLG